MHGRISRFIPTVVVLMIASLLGFGSVAGATTTAAPSYVGSASRPQHDGYWLTAATGKVSASGNAAYYGDMSSVPLNQPIVGIASTSDGLGYWLVASDGGIFSFGDAKFFGSTGSIHLNKPIVGMYATPTGRGYWMVASDGGIFAYGDAQFFGSMGGKPLNKPIMGMSSTTSGHGYWLVASDGGVFSYGDAAFLGSMGGKPLNEPIVAMLPSASGKGYLFIASDGGVFAFGDAKFNGSIAGSGKKVVAITPDAAGGYSIVTSDGTVKAEPVPVPVTTAPVTTTTLPSTTTTTIHVTTTTTMPATTTTMPTTTTTVPSNTTLDRSGSSIPDTNYAIPTGAIFMATTGSDSNAGTLAAPVKTLNKAFSLIGTGGTIVARGGTYRDWYNNGSTFATYTHTFTLQAYPHEQVWFDGTDVETGSKWTSDGAGHWYMAWSTPTFCSNGYYTYKFNAQPTSDDGPCAHWDSYLDPAHPAASDPQMVFVDGQYVNEVLSLSAVDANNFYYDWENRRMYIGTDPNAHLTELAARPTALSFNGNNSNVLGIGFKRYATSEQNNTTEGALLASGFYSTLENDVFTQMAAAGAGGSGRGTYMHNSAFVNNGFDGFVANGHEHSDGLVDNLVIDHSIYDGNDTEGFGLNCSQSCASAGVKLAHMDGYTVKNSEFSNNHGTRTAGFWCDEACTDAVMVNNTVSNNGGSGIFYEVSDTGIIANNLLVGNGADCLKVGSANTKIYNNTCVNNLQGIDVYDDPRWAGYTEGTQFSEDTINDYIVNNVVYGSGFAIKLWRTSADGTSTGPLTTPNFVTEMDYNSYFLSGPTPSNQAIVNVKDPGNIYYRTLAQIQAVSLGWDAHSQTPWGSDPLFVNMAGGNYNVASNSTAYHSGQSLPSDVAAALGLSTSTVVSKGAISFLG